MTGNSKDDPALAALVANVRGEPIGPLITRTEAAKEIAEALKIDHKVAMMTLYGLCVTGDVRWFDDSGEIVDEDAVTIAAFAAKPVSAIAAPPVARIAHFKMMARRRFGSSRSTAANRNAPTRMISET